MIGKVITGKSSYHCISYCLEDKRKLTEEEKVRLSTAEGVQHLNRAEVLEYNLCYGDKWELKDQFRDVERLSRTVENPVLHLTIRPAPGDQLTREQFREIGREAARTFGIDQNQYICVLHHDTQPPHIHIVGNRVGFDGKVVNDSQSYARMAAFCRRMEKQYGLREVLSPRRFLPRQQQKIPRQDQRKEQLRETIREVLKAARTFADFEKRMQEKGYRVDKGRGIAFEDAKKVRVKGSEVGYALQVIERILTQNQQQQRSPIDSKKGKISVARKIVAQALASRQFPIEEQTTGHILGRASGEGISHLLHILFKPEYAGGSGHNPFADEEEWRKRRKRKPPHL